MKLKAVNARIFVGFVAVSLGIIAGNQLLGESRDFANYLESFGRILDNKGTPTFNLRYEPGFTLLVYVLSLLRLDEKGIYGAIVAIIVAIKYLAIPIKRSYVIVLGAFTFYFLTRYFIVFELTVLRAACAFSLAFSVFVRKQSDEYRIGEVALLALAVVFHYSAVVFLFVYFLRNLTTVKVLVVAAGVFATIIVSYASVLTIAPQYLVVFRSYEQFTKATFLPVPYALDLAYFLLMLVYWKKNDAAMQYCAVGLAVGAAIHFGLLEFSLIAGRFRELLSVFILVYVTKAVMSDSKIVQQLAFVYMLLTGLLNLYVVTVHDPLLS